MSTTFIYRGGVLVDTEYLYCYHVYNIFVFIHLRTLTFPLFEGTTQRGGGWFYGIYH